MKTPVTPLIGSATLHACKSFEWQGLNPQHGWRASRDNLDRLDPADGIHWTPTGKPYWKQRPDEYPGVPVGDLWADFHIASGKERCDYPTQKPVAHLELILRTSSNEGDTVLDPFCECATTLVAAERLGRKCIGCDRSALALHLVKECIERELGRLVCQVTHRTDIPRRAVQGKFPDYRTNKHYLYGGQEGICRFREIHFPCVNLAVDHFVPRSKASTGHISNLQLLCAQCNSVKGNRTMAEARVWFAGRTA